MFGWFIEVAELASTQWGLVTIAQAVRLNASIDDIERATSIGLLITVDEHVMKVVGAPDQRHESLQACWLASAPERTRVERCSDAVPDAVVSHLSAATVHRYGDLTTPGCEVTAAGPLADPTMVRLHTGQLQSREWQIVDGLPVTTPARTIADLAAAGLDGGHLATLVRDALWAGAVSVRAAAAALAPAAYRYNLPAGDGNALLRLCIHTAGIPSMCAELAELQA
ncbi:hypothetical protein ACWDUL_20715 [Nocardia niigatensis]